MATGTFGSWHETATNIHLALLAGALDGLGYGRALGRFILEDGATLPPPDDLAAAIAAEPRHPLTAARAELLRTMESQRWPAGRIAVEHRWKHASILAQAFRHGVPMTVHPGIGYDIISNHPVFNGAAIGRAAEWDFKLFAGSLGNLDGGVVLSIGSAIMGPQVFEKALSCVNNLRLQDGLDIIRGHTFYVVDLQDGGGWDWTPGEPPKTNPAYYLRFCKSYSRMGGALSLRAVRQPDVPPSPLPAVGPLMNAERFHAITVAVSGAADRGRRATSSSIGTCTSTRAGTRPRSRRA